MIRYALFLPFTLAACATGPRPLPPPHAEALPVVAELKQVITSVRPVVAKDHLQGRWTITVVNGRKINGLWLDLGAEGLGTVTKTGNAIFVGSPQPPTKAYLGCNNWHPNGWTRNGDKLTLSTEMSTRTERGCDADTIAVDNQAYAILRKTMTMEFSPPNRLRLVNENGTLDLMRNAVTSLLLTERVHPFPSIMVSLPSTWTLHEGSGDDTQTADLRGPDARLRIEYWTFETGGCQSPSCRVDFRQIAGRSTQIWTFSEGRGFRAFVPFGPSVTLRQGTAPVRGIDLLAECNTAAACEEALEVASSLKLG